MRIRVVCSLALLFAVSGCASIGTQQSFRDCAHCPEMVIVPAGTAILGASVADPFHNADELPARTFAIRQAFAVSRYEIRRDEYETFVSATSRAVHGDCLTDRKRRGDWAIDADTTFRDPGFAQTGEHPAACVSWDEAQAFIAWLNAQTDGGYRLLTEVEWEYAARGGSSRNSVYPWGNEQAKGCPFANGFDQTAMKTYEGMDISGYKIFDPLSCSDGWLNTAPVGSLAPNELGLYDIIGNVAEWVADCYQPTRDALAEASTPLITNGCLRRIVKGGSWGTPAHNLRTAERVPYAATHRDDSVGIRVAKTLR